MPDKMETTLVACPVVCPARMGHQPGLSLVSPQELANLGLEAARDPCEVFAPALVMAMAGPWQGLLPGLAACQVVGMVPGMHRCLEICHRVLVWVVGLVAWVPRVVQAGWGRLAAMGRVDLGPEMPLVPGILAIVRVRAVGSLEVPEPLLLAQVEPGRRASWVGDRVAPP